jgi:ABC-2 type transport system permease protein
MDRMVNGSNQRIIVTGDADYLTTPQLFGRHPIRYNYEFGFWCLSYFSYGQFPTNTLRPQSLDNTFKIKVAQIGIQKLILYWIIPALIAVIATVILIRRKRK